MQCFLSRWVGTYDRLLIELERVMSGFRTIARPRTTDPLLWALFFFPDFSLLLLLRPVSLPQFLEDGDLGNQSGDGITRFNGLRKFNGCCAGAPSADRNDSSGENLAPLVGDPSTLCQSLTPICLPMCAPPRDKA